MIQPLGGLYQCRYFDGVAPLRHDAEIELTADAIEIRIPDTPPFVWPYSQLRITDKGEYGEPIRCERTDGAVGEYIALADPQFIHALRQYSPNVPGLAESILPIEGWPAVLMSSTVIVMLAAGMYFWGVRWMASTLAGFMPVSIEERLGRAVTNILAPQASLCTNPALSQQMAPIVERLSSAAGSTYRFQVAYANDSVPNAFAAPGGYIVVYRGLLSLADSPEEVAGVLAHEMQHVLQKHSTKAIARALSARTILSMIAIDTGGAPSAVEAAATLANLSYQREDEEQADVLSVPLLVKAGISPLGLSSMLRKLRTALPFETATYLSTHYNTLDRVDRLELEVRKHPTSMPPLMGREQWMRIRSLCTAN